VRSVLLRELEDARDRRRIRADALERSDDA